MCRTKKCTTTVQHPNADCWKSESTSCGRFSVKNHKAATPITIVRHNNLKDSEQCHLQVTPRGLGAGLRPHLVKF